MPYHIVRQRTTSASLKPKGLGGTPHPPRGACSITDSPRLTSPFLANYRLYTAVVSSPHEGLKVSKKKEAPKRQVEV